MSAADKPVLMPSEVSQRVGFFDRFAGMASQIASRAYFFAFCVLLIVLWAPSYFLVGSIDTWQLIINTATTIITFLMVFLIQNTQNRDSAAVQLKLDELIRATRHADNSLLDLEELEEEELEEIRDQYEKLAVADRKRLRTDKDRFKIFARKGDAEQD